MDTNSVFVVSMDLASVVLIGLVSVGFGAKRCVMRRHMSCAALHRPKGNTTWASLSRISEELGSPSESFAAKLMSESRACQRSSWDGRLRRDGLDNGCHRGHCCSAPAQSARVRWMCGGALALGAYSRSPHRELTMESELSLSGEQPEGQTRFKPPARLMIKHMPPKRMSAPRTQAPTMMAFHHLVAKMNKTGKVPYLASDSRGCAFSGRW